MGLYRNWNNSLYRIFLFLQNQSRVLHLKSSHQQAIAKVANGDNKKNRKSLIVLSSLATIQK